MTPFLDLTRYPTEIIISKLYIFVLYFLPSDAVIEDSSITASDGKKYKTKIYNLDMVISVGYRVKSKRAIIFRKWANKVLREYLIKGYVINELVSNI